MTSITATSSRGRAMLVCASHSPLMLVDMPRSAPDSQDFLHAVDAVRARVERFAPELVVAFGPDHFNGFFFDLMPVYCVGAAAVSGEDWRLPPVALDVPAELAVDLVERLRDQDFDVALSWRMQVDHGITIPLKLFTGLPPAIPVLPVFINCAAPPRAPFRRVRRFGEAVGRHLATLERRVLVLGSGGLSHDPPTPRFADAPPAIRKRLLERNTPSIDELRAREARVVRMAEALVRGEGPCRPPDEAWDRALLEGIVAGDLERFDALTDDAIDRDAGFGGHEVRCWVAAAAAMRALAPSRPRVDYYRIVPEWITGMGLVTTEPVATG
jgi:2,3-dihydroxyphenylpropionate 1,2-dioxygenase